MVEFSSRPSSHERRSGSRRVAITDRDAAVIHAAYSLGYVTAGGLRELISPATGQETFSARLRLLTEARHLTRLACIDGLRRIYLYGIGPRSRAPGSPPPWRPATAQLDHTLAVERALVSLVRAGTVGPLQVAGWHGEGEIRAWARPGEPFPDLRIDWRVGDATGSWQVEVDRATESRAALRRKFGRYLAAANSFDLVLVVTTSPARARNVAVLAHEVGAPVLVATSHDLLSMSDPLVLDAIHRRSHLLSEATLAGSAGGDR